MPAPQPTMSRDEFLTLMAKSQNQPTFDYRDLNEVERALVMADAYLIREAARVTAEEVMLIGQRLIQVKARLKHGQWLPWLKMEFGWAEQTARNFMNVYLNLKSTTVLDLPIDVSALYVIAAPTIPDSVREEIIERAQSGEVMTRPKAMKALQCYKKSLTAAKVQSVGEPLSILIDECRAERAAKKLKTADTATTGTEYESGDNQQPTRQELRTMREEMRINGEHNSKVFAFVHAIETLSQPALPIVEVAAAIRKMDTPDKDWTHQAVTASRHLKELSKEMNV